jgi:hypothetical protein
VDADFSAQTFKHVLVPVWMLAYDYGGKSYQVVVNGYTGTIAGEYPKSWVKILLLILAILVVIIGVSAISNAGKGGSRKHSNDYPPIEKERNIPGQLHIR